MHPVGFTVNNTSFDEVVNVAPTHSSTQDDFTYMFVSIEIVTSSFKSGLKIRTFFLRCLDFVSPSHLTKSNESSPKVYSIGAL